MNLTPAVKTILIINIVFYALTYWITPMFPLAGHSDWFMKFNALHPIGYNGFAWYQFITYMFMHGGWWHLFFNMWSLMIFGSAVEHVMGTKRFWLFYIMCGVGSALFHFALMSISNDYSGLVGASGAIYGLMAAAAFYFPNTQMFIIPIPFPIKLKYLVGYYTATEMYMGYNGLFGVNSGDGVAHFAHLGGILVGIILLLIWKANDKKKARRNNNYWTSSSSYSSNYDKNADKGFWSTIKEKIGGSRKPKMRVTEYTSSSTNDTNAADHAYNQRRRQDSEEIDRILDKIRKNGYQNLTDEEKAKLFDASKRM